MMNLICLLFSNFQLNIIENHFWNVVQRIRKLVAYCHLAKTNPTLQVYPHNKKEYNNVVIRTVLPCRVPLYTHNVKYNRVKISFFSKTFFLFCSLWNRSERRLGILRKVLTGFGLFSREPWWNRRRRSRPRQEPRKNPKRQKANTLSLSQKESRERDRERESIRKYINGIKYSSILPTVYTAEDTRLSVLVIIIDWPLRWFASFVSTKETTAETREPKEEEELLPNFFLFPFF